MSNQIEIKGIVINLQRFNDSDYVSLTDIVKGQEDEIVSKETPTHIIRYWLKNLNTLEFLEEWEAVHNANFKRVQMPPFKLKYLKNNKTLTVKTWIKELDAIGMISKSGRYGGGIFAHKDIALNFCYWLNPKFQVWFIKKFQQLAEQAHEAENFYLNKVFDDSLEINRFSKQMLQDRGELPKEEEE
jgi:hypothetical protein